MFIWCLIEFGGILFDLFFGYMDLIIVVEVILDGGKVFIVFKDNMMKMWDLRIGKVMKIIYDVGINIIRICVGYNVVFVIIVEENVI